MNWYDKLKFARKILGLSLRDVELKTGISNPYLSQLENGQIKEPSFFKMLILIKFYNLDISDFEDKNISAKNEDDKTINDIRNIFKDGHIKRCVSCGGTFLNGTMCPRCFGDYKVPKMVWCGNKES